MSINVYPNPNTLTNSDGATIGEPSKDPLQTEDRSTGPLLEKVITELRLLNDYWSEAMGTDLRD